MGFFDFLKKGAATNTKQAAPVVNNDELRELLFECIDRNHLVEFETLCLENDAEIRRAFSDWKRAPEEIQTDKDQLKKYAYCLMVVASYFQKQRNNGELMTMLTGIDDSEYSRQWQEMLGQAKGLMQQQLKFDEAIPLLEKCLELTSGVSGAGVDKFLPLTLGFLGECYFHKGDPAKAAEYVDRALQTTTMQGDYDASVAYLSNLFEIYRYKGDSAKAAECAKAIADKAYRRSELVTSSNWRHQFRAVSNNEPLHRIVLRIGDELFELDEIPHFSGEKVEFILVRNRMELVLCSQKCHEARELAQSGNYEKSLEVLVEAVERDKFSPQPYYLSGAIKLAGRRYADAVADLEKVEELCPGFETSRSDLWLAKQLQTGTMEHDACMAVFEANNENIPVEQRIKVCEDLTAKYPNFAEAFWRMGRMLMESNRPSEAVEAFKKGMTVADDTDLKSRLLRDLGSLSVDDAEKRRLSKEAIAVPNGNVLAQAMCIYMLSQMDDE